LVWCGLLKCCGHALSYLRRGTGRQDSTAGVQAALRYTIRAVWGADMPSGQQFNSELASRYSRWLVAQRYSPITRAIYGRCVRNFCAFLGNHRATKCTPVHLQEYLIKVAERRPAESSLNNELYSLRIFYDFLTLGQLVVWSPPRMLKGRTVKYVPKMLSEAQVRNLLSATKDLRERAIVEVLYVTGCRTGELRSMKVADVDFDARRIRVRGKRGTRYVRFTRTVSNTLRRYIGDRMAGFLFVDGKPLQQLRPRRGSSGNWQCCWKEYDEVGNFRVINKTARKRLRLRYIEARRHFAELADTSALVRPRGAQPLTSSALLQTVQKIGFRIGLRVHPKILRHTFATHLLDHGANIEDIKELMGHSMLSTTEIYAQASKRKLSGVLERFHPLARQGT
jgi:site-specific recombinase XerD